MTMELANRQVLVVGFERTGEALCRFLTGRGARVRVTEQKPAEAFAVKIRQWRARGVKFETGGHRRESFTKADLVVPSPGVPPIPEIRAAMDKGVPVISEIELAFGFLRGTVIGVTGSNGKSTTATLAHKILKEAGRKAFLAGNIGIPLISFVEKSRDDHLYVTETSSFQLTYTQRFKPHIAVFLNISQNHLDWHGSFEHYHETKKKLVLGLGRNDAAVLNRDDRLVWELAHETEAETYGFSRARRVRKGCFLKDGWVVCRDGGEERLVRESRILLPGSHNRENVMAAALVGRICGVSRPSIRKSVVSFRGLEHRLENVLTVRGVRFVNDSKATTVDATLKALASFDRPIILILGGRSKGGDYAPLRRAVRNKVKSAVLIGEAADMIETALGGIVPAVRVSTYRQAVRAAFAAARRGDVILLAPACTSWDMFRNFEERGRVFKREARLLAARNRREKD